MEPLENTTQYICGAVLCTLCSLARRVCDGRMYNLPLTFLFYLQNAVVFWQRIAVRQAEMANYKNAEKSTKRMEQGTPMSGTALVLQRVQTSFESE